MSKIEELQTKIDELQKELDELKKKEKETEEDVEFFIEKLKVLAELKAFAEPKGREWDGENQHWSIWHNAREDRVYAECWRVGKTNSIYFKSKEKAKQAIDAVGEDRIKKYYLEVE